MNTHSHSKWNCPHCGNATITLNGVAESGRQKYHCDKCEVYGEFGLEDLSIHLILSRMQATPAIRGTKLLNPEIRAAVRERFGQELTPVAVPTAYAQTLFNYIAYHDVDLYQRKLPPESWRMIERWKPFFRHIARYGLIDDSRWFNELIALELMKVYADDWLEPQQRVTAMYAAGNLLYLIQLLEDFADYPFRTGAAESPKEEVGE